MRTPPAVHTSTDFFLISTDGSGASTRITAIPVRLSYHPRDPYAVHLRFATGPTRHVDWVFARALLADGLLTHSGEGDVQVRPGPRATDDVVVVELDSPSGHACFEVAASAVADFLDDSYRAVPPGAEAQRVDLEAVLAALLRPQEH